MSRLAEAFYLAFGRYPEGPGWSEETTSRAAARAVSAGSTELRERVLEAIRRAGVRGLTPDEAAAEVGRKPAYVRPRVTELAKSVPPRIVPTGERRKNESGLSAKVWRVA